MSLVYNIAIKVFFTFALILLFRIGLYIPSPSINFDFFFQFFLKSDEFKITNIVSSGLFGSFSLLSLGIMPYILSSIATQIIVHFAQGDGVNNKNKDRSELFPKLIRWFALLFASIQCIILFVNDKSISNMFFYIPGYEMLSYALCFFSVLTGSMVALWIGETITEYGIGNGVSMLIFANVSSDLIGFLSRVFKVNSAGGAFLNWFLLIFLLGIIFSIIFFEKACRFVLVRHSSSKFNVVNNGTYSFPMKINFAGVMPVIFASTVIAFIFSGISSLSNIQIMNIWYAKILYYLFYFLLLLCFSYIYNGLIFNSKRVSDSLKKNNSVIPDVRPGEFTKNYFDKILANLTIFGACYLFATMVIIDFVKYFTGVNNSLSGSSMIILIVMSLELISKIQMEISKFYNPKYFAMQQGRF